MPLSIDLSKLGSRIVRATIGDTTGIRRFAVSATTTRPSSAGGTLNIWGGASRFFNSFLSTLWERLQTGTLTFTKIVGFITSAVRYIFNFNWNMDIDDVNQKMKSQLESLAGQLGSVIGTSIGYLVCGAVPGVLLFGFNEALALYVLKEVGEEALEDIAGQTASLIRQSFTSMGVGLLEYGYVGLKGMINSNFSSITKAFLETQGVDTTKLKEVQQQKKKPWSFAKGIEDLVESIPVQAVENFVENLLEEAAESCIEAGYVVANALDAQMAASQLTAQSSLGERHSVEVIFNRQTATTPNSSTNPTA